MGTGDGEMEMERQGRQKRARRGQRSATAMTVKMIYEDMGLLLARWKIYFRAVLRR